jgi:hypothetical protein
MEQHGECENHNEICLTTFLPIINSLCTWCSATCKLQVQLLVLRSLQYTCISPGTKISDMTGLEWSSGRNAMTATFLEIICVVMAILNYCTQAPHNCTLGYLQNQWHPTIKWFCKGKTGHYHSMLLKFIYVFTLYMEKLVKVQICIKLLKKGRLIKSRAMYGCSE